MQNLSQYLKESVLQGPFWRSYYERHSFNDSSICLGGSDSENQEGLRFRLGSLKKDSSGSSSGPILRSWIKKNCERGS